MVGTLIVVVGLSVGQVNATAAESTKRPTSKKTIVDPKHQESATRLQAALKAEAKSRSKKNWREEAEALAQAYRELSADEAFAKSKVGTSSLSKARNRLAWIHDKLVVNVQAKAMAQATASGENATAYAFAGANASFGENDYPIPTADRYSSQMSARGGGMVEDPGALIALIENVIEPDFWESRGGPGSIQYWRPGMALVVRATGNIHGDVGKALRGLRQ